MRWDVREGKLKAAPWTRRYPVRPHWVKTIPNTSRPRCVDTAVQVSTEEIIIEHFLSVVSNPPRVQTGHISIPKSPTQYSNDLVALCFPASTYLVSPTTPPGPLQVVHRSERQLARKASLKVHPHASPQGPPYVPLASAVNHFLSECDDKFVSDDASEDSEPWCGGAFLDEFWTTRFEYWWTIDHGHRLPTLRDLAPPDADIPEDELDDPETNEYMQTAYDWWRRHRFRGS